jgi:SAM-dependent methyltransferase
VFRLPPSTESVGANPVMVVGYAGDVTTFRYKGFDIPEELAVLTGAGEESWHVIALEHLNNYEWHCPIRPGQRVVEIGCGVGRDAMHLPDRIGDGSYLGVDIIPASIEWCRANITPRFANFDFQLLDVYNRFYNPSGSLSGADVKLPVPDGSVDRILLQSVFTHMFEIDITSYMQEFARVLAPEGLVFATFFLLDQTTKTLIEEGKSSIVFRHPHGDGCWIQFPDPPEAAVAYEPHVLARMLERSGLELDQPIHHGAWSGREARSGQDATVLRTYR